MNFRNRTALGLALLLTLITSTVALAKGNFAFIIVSGGNLKNKLRLTDPALTNDFLVFADLFRNEQAEAPANPGIGYEITRYYSDNGVEQAFDHLHYYPDTGFVYYDGMVNGWSEYDGHWYRAQPRVKTAFEKALGKKAFPPITPFILTAGLVILLIVLRRTKPVRLDG
jgi:hypothetical protein